MFKIARFLFGSLVWFLLVPRRMLALQGSRWWLSETTCWGLPSKSAPRSWITKCRLEITPCTTHLPVSGNSRVWLGDQGRRGSQHFPSILCDFLKLDMILWIGNLIAQMSFRILCPAHLFLILLCALSDQLSLPFFFGVFLFGLGSLGGSPLAPKLSPHEVSCLHLKQAVQL